VSAEETAQRISELVPARYRSAYLRTTTIECDARVSKKGDWQCVRRAVATAAPPTAHNRGKQYLIPEGTPCPFLEAIGVMTAAGQVRAQQQHKFRQINRYLEFVADVVPQLPAEGTLHIVDCGCGRSGLTFALHHYLTRVRGREVRLTGLDRNADVIEGCRALATRLGLADEIGFEVGDIASHQPAGETHLVVSLHACDTATDAALARAVDWQAQAILAVPCCQHELAPQLRSEPLAGLLQYGLLRERFAADATDALRALWLELHGYKTQVLEFIDLEHTPKNLLLRAIRRATPVDPSRQTLVTDQFEQLRSLLGIERFALTKTHSPEQPRD
jgi:hypothetical protein